MTRVFWLSAFIIGYVYAGYPALLAVWARVVRRPTLPEPPAWGRLPGVSIVLAARNEGARLPARLENLLALDYPSDRRQIVVVSDGSTDDTLEVLAAYRDRVDVVAIPAGGKATALNAGVARAVHDVLVFADARQTFAGDALRALVAPLADPRIGGVSGELVLDCETHSHATEPTVGAGIGTYWRYEKWLRRHESAIGSLLGATGAIYALRRSLWRPLPPETVLDDVLAPMRAVLAGRRVIFEERAKAFDRAARSSREESRRKARTLAGNVQILWLEPRLLVPIVNPVWLQYCSHKVGRLVVPYALIALLASNMALADHGGIYALALAGQCAFYLLAGYGACLELAQRAVPERKAVEPGEVNA
jgi:biofilm PGA synthesis N-glycosyltransferase PgaC